MQWASGDAVGAVINRPGDSAPAGAVSTGDAPPHSLFGLAQKENAPRPVEEKKSFRRAPVQWPSGDGGRRISASADLA